MGKTVSVGGGDHNITVYGNGTVYAGNGNDSITITGSGKVVAGDGNDTVTIDHHGRITVGGGDDKIHLSGSGTITENGLSGNDTINLGAGNDTIFEAGHATVHGFFGTAKISGGEFSVTHHHGKFIADAISGNATLLGGSGPEVFVGGIGSTFMKGGTGNDTFIGGSGSDTMKGGSGKNVFAFLPGEGGNHVITNFVSGQDRLYLEGHTLAYLEKHDEITITVTTSGPHAGTLITLDGGKTSIELKGFTSPVTGSDITTHK